MLTPAISVLSAVEGVGIGSPLLEPLILPLALIILVGLFVLQSRGTAKIGRLFGPVMAAVVHDARRAGHRLDRAGAR